MGHRHRSKGLWDLVGSQGILFAKNAQFLATFAANPERCYDIHGQSTKILLIRNYSISTLL